MWPAIITISVIIISSIVRFIFLVFRSEKHSTLLSNNPPETIVTKEAPTMADMTQPDRPTVFGYKGTWLAVKGNDTHEIAVAAGVRNPQPCNWTFGVEKAYVDAVFITPPIDGWTLLVSQATFPDTDSQEGAREVKQLLNDLSSRFDEAQYFGTHRGVGYAAWFRSVNGEITRAYSIIEGETIIAEGEAAANENVTDPFEDDVMAIAGAWSVDPSALNGRQDLGPGLGLLGSR